MTAYEARVGGGELDVGQDALERPRSEVAQQHVGMGEQVAQRRRSGVALQVERDAALAVIEPHEMGRPPVHGAVVVTCEVTLIRPLDLDDVSAEVRKVP